MDRKAELQSLFKNGGNDELIACRLIDEIVFLEARLSELRALPFLSVNPKNPAQNRQTPAAKQYKELLQQYTNSIKILCKMTGVSETEEESPLRSFMRQLNARDAE